MTKPIEPADFTGGTLSAAALPDRLAFAPVPVAPHRHGGTAAIIA